MTRITNFGRKRTYVQAGFTNDLPVQEPADSRASISSIQLDKAPPKKKRKEAKKQKENDDEQRTKSFENKAGDTVGSEKVGAALKKKLNEKQKTRVQPDPAQRSESRRQRRIAEKHADTTCFACRQKGHAARDCPSTRKEALGGRGPGRQSNVGICYRCGLTQHNLSRCKAPEDPHNPLPFASCFVCSGKGHLASSCPQNKDKGVYPNGGCCKLCSETSHLAKDCALRKQAQSGTATFFGTGHGAGADEDDFHTFKRRNTAVDRDLKKDKRTKKDVKAEPCTEPVDKSAKVKKVVYF